MATTRKPTDKTPTFTCVARRHLSASLFKTYDAMVGLATYWQNQREANGEPRGPLTFSGAAWNLANRNDRNESIERDNITNLEELGWVVATHEEQRRRSRTGAFATNEWRIIEHGEFVAAHPNSCPPPRYDAEGKPVKPGLQPRPLKKKLLRAQAARHKLKFADDRTESRFLDLMIDLAPTNAETSAQVKVTNAEPSAAACAEFSAAACAEPSAPTVAETSATMSVYRSPEAKSPKTAKPARLPSENGRLAGDGCDGEPSLNKSKSKTDAQR